MRQIQADGSEYTFRYQLAGATSSGAGCTVVNPPTGGGVTGITLPFVACPTVDSWENLQAGYTVTGGTVTATTVVDPRGHATTTRFNGLGYAVSTTDALGQTTTTPRTAANQVASSIDPLGRTTKFEYDTAGNVKKIVDPNNQQTQFEYQPTFNRVTKITDALNQITEFSYDNTNGNLLTVKDPLNHVTTLAYNAFGQPTSVQGPIATEPPTTFAYDTNGNLITTTDPLGNATQRVYDAVSRLTSLTDPRGLQTQFRYDGLNRVTEIADARQGIMRFGYDQNGNLLTVTDAKNQMTAYTYDSMDRLATRKDALNRSESYQYDLAGNLSQFRDRKNQQTTFAYDALNRRTTATYPDATTMFAYDSVGRLTRASDSLSGTIDRSYDILDRLIQETTPQGTIAYTYDTLRRRASSVVNGQTAQTYNYDVASRLISLIQGTQTITFGYDAADRKTSITYPNGISVAYGYDAASRLTSLTHQGPSGPLETLTYTLDSAGNRISLLRNSGSATTLPPAIQAAYDAANEQVRFNSVTPNLTYDADGNLLTQTDTSGTTTYTWDARDRLRDITGPNLIASFAYDAFNRRMSKTVNGQTTAYLYDGDDVVQEIGAGAVSASYVQGLGIDEPYIRRGATGDEFYLADERGTVLALTNQAGAVTTSYAYEPFGKATQTGVSSNPFQYTGRDNDGTGLYYYRARYYSPILHRFLSEDPLEFEGEDLNLYAYAFNDPVNLSDPSGELVPLVPLAGICLRGAAQSALSTALSGRKPDLMDLASGCFSGGINKLPGISKVVPKVPGGGKGPKKQPKNFVPPTNPPQPPPPIPPGWTSRPSNSGGGTVHQQPGSTRNANSIRVMPPGADPNYPNGYWVQTNSHNQRINPATGKPGVGDHDVHVPLPSGYFP
ncbi:MAG: RHS repeat-associated core domain-containing protein [Nitrospira sp.]|nr:RHS repeat-associated core domain-containing protein [Nitrospira sp.]